MKKRYILNFPASSIDEPITYHLVKEYDIIINILNADISEGREGFLLLEMKAEAENIQKALDYLEKHNITSKPLSKTIHWNENECIHCGSCTSVCFAGALHLDRNSWQLNFDKEKCNACELCLKACPLKLFEIDFG